jgi:uncharacterized BrkB/YihY/UPF0761 family membrane protein
MIGKAWVLIKDMVSGFIEHEDLSRGAAIAYYTIFSIAPLLIIVIAIAGLVFGHDAAQGAIVGQLRGLIVKQSAEILQSMIQSASHETTGVFATVIGVGTLLLTSTGAFAEIQSALDAVWKATPSGGFSALIRSRLMGLGLVFTLGFLMLVSLVVSAGVLFCRRNREPPDCLATHTAPVRPRPDPRRQTVLAYLEPAVSGPDAPPGYERAREWHIREGHHLGVRVGT